MTRMIGNSDFTHGRDVKVGVLVCNLGTPDRPTVAAVRRYLAEFLSDPRVVELPRWLWLPILHGIILNTRPRRSAHAYGKVWTSDGAPLLRLSEQLVANVASAFAASGSVDVEFALGMRYGKPSIASALDQLLAAQARRILVLPLYPQYAAATTASVHDAVFAYCARLRWIPELRFVTHYHSDPRYIAALAQSVTSHWQNHGRGERLLLSFHGIPQDTFLAGDPYYCQCHATARLLGEELGLGPAHVHLTFQSRVGPKKWLEPYTEQTLKAWGREGVGNVDVLCPGFAVDCLETLEEIAMQNAAWFSAAGGGELRYIAALNDSAAHVTAIKGIIHDHLGSWLEQSAADAIEQPAAGARARAAGGK